MPKYKKAYNNKKYFYLSNIKLFSLSSNKWKVSKWTLTKRKA